MKTVWFLFMLFISIMLGMAAGEIPSIENTPLIGIIILEILTAFGVLLFYYMLKNFEEDSLSNDLTLFHSFTIERKPKWFLKAIPMYVVYGITLALVALDYVKIFQC